MIRGWELAGGGHPRPRAYALGHNLPALRAWELVARTCFSGPRFGPSHEPQTSDTRSALLPEGKSVYTTGGRKAKTFIRDYMTHHQAHEFAKDWIDSWNSHDLERVLSHYAEDFEMRSPFISQFVNEPSGRLVGKEKVRNYWQVALSKIPDLHFQLIDVQVGATSIAIRYSNQAGKQATEVLFFGGDGLVVRAAAHYSP